MTSGPKEESPRFLEKSDEIRLEKEAGTTSNGVTNRWAHDRRYWLQ